MRILHLIKHGEVLQYSSMSDEDFSRYPHTTNVSAHELYLIDESDDQRNSLN